MHGKIFTNIIIFAQNVVTQAILSFKSFTPYMAKISLGTSKLNLRWHCLTVFISFVIYLAAAITTM